MARVEGSALGGPWVGCATLRRSAVSALGGARSCELPQVFHSIRSLNPARLVCGSVAC